MNSYNRQSALIKVPKTFIIVSLLICLLLPITAFALEGEDTFYLKSSNVVDGDTNICHEPIIELTFTDNMDDITVLEFNKKCFHLTDKDGNPVEIKIVFPDTQMENFAKANVFLIPTNPLVAGETYTITVDANLTAKKGGVLDKTYSLSFRTTGEGEKSDPAHAKNDTLERLGENILEYIEKTAPKAFSDSKIDLAKSVTQSSDDNQDTSQNKVLIIAIVIIATIILLSVGGLLFNKSKHKV